MVVIVTFGQTRSANIHENGVKRIIVAGATGNLGQRIINALLKKDVEIRALVRVGSDVATVEKLRNLGVTVFTVNMVNADEVVAVCRGASFRHWQDFRT